MNALNATLRLQMHAGFTFDDARAQVDYAHALGITHFYLSPITTARSGSTHGYDVIDYCAVNPELGGEPALRLLVDALRSHQMGVVLDIVPNHMAAVSPANAWWYDVLTFGTQSRYAAHFDIEWTIPDALLAGKVLLPLLAYPYGEALERGTIRLEFNAAAARFEIGYEEHRFPLAPASYPSILATVGAAAELDLLAIEFQRFTSAEDEPGRYATTRVEHFSDLRVAVSRVLEAPDHGALIAQILSAFEPSSATGRERLHGLLEQQHYRLASWRTAAEEINWRRFFEISELIGVCQERLEVFEDSHALVFRLFRDGLIDGLRIDHVDGLADPAGYLAHLTERLAILNAQRPEALRLSDPTPILIEKILADEEPLRATWQTDGTTGYEFMNQVLRLLVDDRAEHALTTIWVEVSANASTFDEEETRARGQILTNNLASEYEAVARLFHALTRANAATRDITLIAMRRILFAWLERFRIYRTYVNDAADSVDLQTLNATVDAACSTLIDADAVALRQLRVLFEEPAAAGIFAEGRRYAIQRFQQLCAPLAAKSVEDTAFYRYGRLLALNEVGGNPAHFALTGSDFHALMVARADHWPRALSATATHDHKRGEDVRARLAVLSECPILWGNLATQWRSRCGVLRDDVDGVSAPDAQDEFMLLQMLVGAWPLTLEIDDGDAVGVFFERLATWQEKALREAKRHSSWSTPSAPYEDACRLYLEKLAQPTQRPLLEAIKALAGRLDCAGALNGLAQAMLRCTVPGVPDLYQGCDFWDMSLVDPDNREPVDYASRSRDVGRAEPLEHLMNHWRDGRIKQRVVRDALRARSAYPELFRQGTYVPLSVTGNAGRSIFAFCRVDQDRAACVIVSRLAWELLGQSSVPCIAADLLEGTHVVLPSALHHHAWHSVTTGKHIAPCASIHVAQALAEVPVSLLISA